MPERRGMFSIHLQWLSVEYEKWIYDGHQRFDFGALPGANA
jgi:hypothetical protein